MTAVRAMWLIPVLFLLMQPVDLSAQGRGHKNKNKATGPAFCRNGAGHPVFGWEWCRARGWGDAYRTNQQAQGRAIPRNTRQRDPYANRSGNRRFGDVAFDNGYADGYEKGLDDGNDRREFDPTRHRWYRDADREYNREYGSRAQYANVYRDGFKSGYEAGYADGDRYRNNQGTSRLPWPF